MKVGIIWDLEDGFDNEVNYLPQEVDIPESIKEEDVADWISDEFGFCVENWWQI